MRAKRMRNRLRRQKAFWELPEAAVSSRLLSDRECRTLIKAIEKHLGGAIGETGEEGPKEKEKSFRSDF